uniref:Reverse transcriptase domain-containing protein n=1 Tax=Angiostrongylus cantonensis TaxID=6313 RepID=A0A0K0D9D7_ANGCA
MEVKMDGRQLYHFRFADDIVLITLSISEAEQMVADFDKACRKIGLRLNLTKTMFMKNGLVLFAPLTLNGTNISECSGCVYLGREIIMMNELAPELSRRKRAACGAFKSIEDVDLKDVEEADVIAYDIGISRRSRAKYFVNFITTGKCFTKVALDTRGKIVGIGCVRAVYSNDLCAGPVFADSEVIAASLLAGILLRIPNLRKYKMFASLYPAINENAARLFDSIGGTKAKIVPFTQCQFTKKVFPVDDVKVFAMTECACSVV